jgi:hypothetical protein
MTAIPNGRGRGWRRLRSALTGPGDVWLALRMLSWAALLPLLKRFMPLPRLAHLMWAGRGGERSPKRERQVAALLTLIYRSGRSAPRDNCLERGLLSYRFLSEANADPRLVVGVARDDPADGHVWVVVDGQATRESETTLDRFVPLVAFGTGGESVPLSAS